MKRLPPAYCVTVTKPDGNRRFIVHGLAAARRELKAQQRLNHDRPVTLSKVAA